MSKQLPESVLVEYKRQEKDNFSQGPISLRSFLHLISVTTPLRCGRVSCLNGMSQRLERAIKLGQQHHISGGRSNSRQCKFNGWPAFGQGKAMKLDKQHTWIAYQQNICYWVSGQIKDFQQNVHTINGPVATDSYFETWLKLNVLNDRHWTNTPKDCLSQNSLL